MVQIRKQNGQRKIIIVTVAIVVAALLVGLAVWFVFLRDKPTANIEQKTSNTQTTGLSTSGTQSPEAVGSVDENKADTTIVHGKADSDIYSMSIPDGWILERHDVDGFITFFETSEVDNEAVLTEAVLTYKPGIPATIKVFPPTSGGRGLVANFYMATKDQSEAVYRSEQTKTDLVLASGQKIQRYEKVYDTDADEGEGGVYYKGTRLYFYEIPHAGKYIMIVYQIDPGQNDALSVLEQHIKNITLK